MQAATRGARRRTLCLALAASLLGAGVAAVNAWAHDGVSVVHGDDLAAVYENHSHIDWCDRETDGNRVRAWYQYSTTGPIGIRPTDWDPNGSNAGCGHENPLSCGLCALLYFQVCEENVGCSNWKEG
jgi:hypothetical protein